MRPSHGLAAHPAPCAAVGRSNPVPSHRRDRGRPRRCCPAALAPRRPRRATASPRSPTTTATATMRTPTCWRAGSPRRPGACRPSSRSPRRLAAGARRLHDGGCAMLFDVGGQQHYVRVVATSRPGRLLRLRDVDARRRLRAAPARRPARSTRAWRARSRSTSPPRPVPAAGHGPRAAVRPDLRRRHAAEPRWSIARPAA